MDNTTRKKRSVKTIVLIASVVFVVALALILFFTLRSPVLDTSKTILSPFSVSFFDVGQGDCELITCNGRTILIDGGEKEYSGRVVSYLRNKGINKIDCYILSHPHSDHIGVSADVMSNFEIGDVLSTAFSEDNIPTTATYERTLLAIDEYAGKYIEVKAGDTFRYGELNISILSPSEEYEEYNDMSIVCRITFRNVSALFCGDATAAIEEKLLENGAKLQSDIYKVSHHGSSTSNTYDFLEAVCPQVCVISCGKGNSYGHPHSEIIQNLDKLGIKYYRTDRQGTVVVSSDGSKIAVSTGG